MQSVVTEQIDILEVCLRHMDGHCNVVDFDIGIGRDSLSESKLLQSILCQEGVGGSSVINEADVDAAALLDCEIDEHPPIITYKPITVSTLQSDIYLQHSALTLPMKVITSDESRDGSPLRSWCQPMMPPAQLLAGLDDICWFDIRQQNVKVRRPDVAAILNVHWHASEKCLQNQM